MTSEATGDDLEVLRQALLNLESARYEAIRRRLIVSLGYETFNDLQTRAFELNLYGKERGT
jgi:hypothetical protein